MKNTCNVSKRSVGLFIGLTSMLAVGPTGSPFLESGRATLPTGARSPYTRPQNPRDAQVSGSSLATVDKETKARVNQVYGELPMSFEANDGQTDSRVKFISRWGGQTLFLTSTEAVLRLAGPNRTPAPEGRPTLSVDDSGARRSTIESTNSVLRMKLVGANASAKVTGLDELPGKSNYFIGNDPQKWRVNVPNYAKVKYEQVYPGVDLVYYGNQRQLEYDLIVAPGADARRIRLAFEGAEKVYVDEAGDLVLIGAFAETRQHKPLVYQEVNGAREEVPGRYLRRGHDEIGFELGRYDTSKPLIIDPVLSYSTYLGGSGGESANAIAVDSAGNSYITGVTFSRDFPTVNPVQPDLNLGCCLDVFVTKLNASGSALIYSTFLGGSRSERGNGVAVDPSGNACIVGTTDSTDFPVANAFQPAHTGFGSDAFVVKLNNSGSVLLYSTYLGGNQTEEGRAIAADIAGNAYITGFTASQNFPKSNPLQPVAGPGFVTKFNSTGTSLVYSTYFGVAGRSIAIDSLGNAYVAGEAGSPNLPLVNAVQSELKGRSLFKSLDASVTWTDINNGVPQFFSVTALAIDPLAPTTVYAGVGSPGIFKSNDGGASWSTVNNSVAVNQLLIDPKTTTTIYGTDGSRIRKSTDSGVNWNIVDTFGNFRALAIDPINPSNLYAALSQSMSKSTDGGASWRLIGVFDQFHHFPVGIRALAIDPNNPSIVYLGDGDGTVFKSADGGDSWLSRSEFFPLVGLALDPANVSTLYRWSNGSGISKSTDGAQTWTLMNSGLGDRFVQVFAIDPTTTSTLYAGTRSGTYRSIDGGISWTSATNSLTNASVLALAIDPQNPAKIYAGTQATTDVFVFKISQAGSALLYSTYLGGDLTEIPLGIGVDASGNVYITGLTRSSNFPTRNPLKTFNESGPSAFDGFVTKLSTTHPEIFYSTYLGGSGSDTGRAIAVDAAGIAYVAGQTFSTDLPLVSPLPGIGNSYVSVLNAAGTAFQFSTYLSDTDSSNGLSLDGAGNIYVTGSTSSNSFPTTSGAFQRAKGGTGQTAFVSKIAFFDLCLQDDSSGSTLQINSATGDYQFVNCAGLTLSGTGALIRKGCLITLQVNGPDRRLLARIDTCQGTGTASMQVFSQGRTFTILDRNTANSACACSR